MSTYEDDAQYFAALRRAGFIVEPVRETAEQVAERRSRTYPPGHCMHLVPVHDPEPADPICPGCTSSPCVCGNRTP